jgi:hypothetical protein
MNLKSYAKKTINDLVCQSYWYNNIMFKDCKKFWDLKTNNIEVVNLGSSSGTYDFDYSDIDIKSANWAIAPQTLVGDWAVIKQYQKYLKPGANIIFALCPFTSLSGAAEYVEERCYTILDFELIPHAHYISKSKVMNVKNNPLQFYPLMQLKVDLARKIKRNTSKNIKNDEQFSIDSQNWMQSWMRQFELTDLSATFTGRNKMEYDKSVALFAEIIDYCLENGFNPVVVIPPMHYSLASRFSSSDRENLIDSFVNKVNTRHVFYFNMMDDVEFTNDKSLFRNSYYLNEKGSKIFTSYLLAKLNIIDK